MAILSFRGEMKKDIMVRCSFRILFILITSLILLSSNSFANNLSISNVSLADRDTSTKTLIIQFDISWENSWKTKINHDAVWVTARLSNPSAIPSTKSLCQLTSSGANPTGTSVGSNIGLEIYVPTDLYGAFIRPTTYGMNSSISSTEVQFAVNYNSCGFSDDDTVEASLFAVEMVYVPEGSFYAGDYATSTASLKQGSSDSDPWQITSGSSISVTDSVSDSYYYVSNSNSGEDSTGAAFTISSSFPNGYNAFYSMKYEITEEQWVEFVNSLPSSSRVNRDLTNASHKNSDSVTARNTISCSGSPLVCSTSRPARAVSYLSWMDLTAFLDWAALRPMSELEFEKLSRGPVLPLEGEYAWGSSTVVEAAAITGSSEIGDETITNSNANAHCNNVTLSGGDTANGAGYAQGPLRVGIFATSGATRLSSGSGYYGAMELSGNVREQVVTIGNLSGRSFTGANGDGALTSTSGYEGNANVNSWPGLDAVSSRGITGAAGSGLKGGAWTDLAPATTLQISDRSEAAVGTTSALNNYGGRGVRSSDE